jgi:ABC-type lipoprotein release transport system permease subunit
MSYEDAHSNLPDDIHALIDKKKAFPVLVSQVSIYPGGRIMPAILKGIPPDQNIVNMPTEALQGINDGTIPVLIGKGMAKDSKLKVGDSFTIRWMDADKTYDADEGTVVYIMDTENFKLDMGHIWVPLNIAQSMLEMKEEATYVTYAKGLTDNINSKQWISRDVNYLVQDMEAIIEADKPGAQIMYMILLALAAMGIFNAQVLSIFRRGKEIGTLMALGMTRSKVVGLFTLEGGINTVNAEANTALIPPSNVKSPTTFERVIPSAISVPISFPRLKIDRTCALNIPIAASANKIIYIICAPGLSASIIASISCTR